MSHSIDALDLPIQLFAVGTVIGMASALIRHAQTGDVDHWPVYIAIPSITLFFAGVLQTVVGALISWI
jgi:hypothetical protein